MLDILQEIDKLQEEIKRRRPLERGLLKQVREYYRIGLTYSSNAIEGNSLTETETKIILEEGITIGGKPLKDHYEAVGHSEAYDHLYKLAGTKTIKEADIKKLHKLFYHRIDENRAGRYRKARAFITGSRYPVPSPEAIPGMMEESVVRLEGVRGTSHPVEAAAMAHKELVFIHPFVDGNGRVARLLMNLILLQEGCLIAIIPPVVRAEYIHALEKAHEDDKDFIELVARMVRESQRDYLRLFA